MTRVLPVMAAVLASAMLAACGPQTTKYALPVGFPPFKLDVNASEARVTNATNAGDIRQWVAETISGMQPLQPTEAEPARFKVTVSVRASTSPIVPIAALLFVVSAPMWLPLGDVNASVELVMDVGGQRFIGKAEDQQTIHFNSVGTDDYLKAAVTNAVGKALAEAREQAAVAGVLKAKLAGRGRP
ncbi:MAG TPA: hypothetical protein VGQ83_05820 [Polyangia bacterium]|jgi:hypothetical protein